MTSRITKDTIIFLPDVPLCEATFADLVCHIYWLWCSARSQLRRTSEPASSPNFLSYDGRLLYSYCKKLIQIKSCTEEKKLNARYFRLLWSLRHRIFEQEDRRVIGEYAEGGGGRGWTYNTRIPKLIGWRLTSSGNESINFPPRVWHINPRRYIDTRIYFHFFFYDFFLYE